eukprot:scaffold492_cov257-Pinguiococcus_pyrenoidosus.AAC.11
MKRSIASLQDDSRRHHGRLSTVEATLDGLVRAFPWLVEHGGLETHAYALLTQLQSTKQGESGFREALAALQERLEKQVRRGQALTPRCARTKAVVTDAGNARRASTPLQSASGGEQTPSRASERPKGRDASAAGAIRLEALVKTRGETDDFCAVLETNGVSGRSRGLSGSGDRRG